MIQTEPETPTLLSQRRGSGGHSAGGLGPMLRYGEDPSFRGVSGFQSEGIEVDPHSKWRLFDLTIPGGRVPR